MKPTVGSLVAAQPSLGAVFSSLGIDYCCGGHLTLEEAAAEKKLDPRTLELVLAALPARAVSAPGENPADFPTPRLIEHIVNHHHAYVKRQLPRLEALASKVVRAHGDAHKSLTKLEAGVFRLSKTLSEHLSREEAELFPALIAAGPGVNAGVAATLAPFFEEHEEAGALLVQFRELTDQYAHPVWACSTYRTFMDELRDFETDLHQHVHLENNVLFHRIAG
jgi:regulator of cell morphogenesis and NO signaling